MSSLDDAITMRTRTEADGSLRVEFRFQAGNTVVMSSKMSAYGGVSDRYIERSKTELKRMLYRMVFDDIKQAHEGKMVQKDNGRFMLAEHLADGIVICDHEYIFQTMQRKARSDMYIQEEVYKR